MPQNQRILAIEVDSDEAWEAVCALQPHYKELSAEENRGRFVVVSAADPKLEGAIIPPGAVENYFDHIEPSDVKIKLVTLVR